MSGRKRYEATQYASFSPREKEVRIKRAARAMLQGVTMRDLERRGFTSTELDKAAQMARPGGKK